MSMKRKTQEEHEVEAQFIYLERDLFLIKNRLEMLEFLAAKLDKKTQQKVSRIVKIVNSIKI